MSGDGKLRNAKRLCYSAAVLRCTVPAEKKPEILPSLAFFFELWYSPLSPALSPLVFSISAKSDFLQQRLPLISVPIFLLYVQGFNS